MVRTIAFIVVFLASMGFFFFSARGLFGMLRLGRAESRSDQIGKRLGRLLKIALAQGKILRHPVIGALHALVFWGFCVITIGTMEMFLDGFFGQALFEDGFDLLHILGPLYAPFAFSQDLFGILVLVSCCILLFRRIVIRPKRLSGPEMGGEKSVSGDAVFVLSVIGLLMLSLFPANALHGVPDHPARFATIAFANLTGLEDGHIAYEIGWWVHIVCVLGFLNFLPYSKHLHVLTSLPNVYLSNLESMAKLPTLDLSIMEDDDASEEDLENMRWGISDLKDVTWKTILDSLTCTECGRCTDVCPANGTGKVLSPRKIVMNVRDRAEGLAKGHEQPDDEHLLNKGYISQEELWACTTCQACVQECPVTIEHVPVIVDMRRHLVQAESEFPEELQTMFSGLENAGNPWSMSGSRMSWADGMGIAEFDSSKHDVLLWIGCAGAYNDRYKKVVRSFAKLLQRAEVRFGCLGDKESCSGDPARRAGNEFLAQMFIKGNVDTLNELGTKRVVTACPHCFNTMANEYPDFGGKWEVQHHSELLADLVKMGKLQPEAIDERKVTYHDSCYIGRGNDIYDQPRDILNAIPGVQAVEMKRNKSRGFCCGAGGAQMFMEETVGDRINVTRAKEALDTGADTVAAACPFCMTMLDDGVTLNGNEDVEVLDIAELLDRATTPASEEQTVPLPPE